MTGPDAELGEPGSVQLERLLESDPVDLYENAPCGYLSMVPDGRIVKVNATFCAWTGLSADAVRGRRFADLLAVGSRVFLLTHLWPLLRMQGAVQEIALDVVRSDGTVLPCLFNAVEVRNPDGEALLVRATVFDATARRRYEQDLLAAQRRAEESEQRSRSLQLVVSDLAAATTVAAVAAVIVEHGRAMTGARGAALVLRDELAPPADDGADVQLDLHTETSVGLSPQLIQELRAAAAGQAPAQLASGVRTVELTDRLRAGRPGVAAAMAADGLVALQLVPISAHGRPLGMLVMGIGDVDESELISLREPGSPPETRPAERDALETFSQQAGEALERARLHEETARQAERSAFLLEAARLLALASDVSDTVQRLADLAVTRLADVCTIDLETENGPLRQVIRHRDATRQAMADELRVIPQRSGARPSLQALREGRTVWIRRLDDELPKLIDDPRRLAVTRELGLTSLVSVPFVADGRVLGALTLATDEHRPRYSAADVEVVEQLALQVALVVAKAQRYELDVRASHTLQANLLPPPPPVLPGLATAVRYLTATHGVEVGGDFYDVVALPDGQVALAVGDVVGHDITAAATMGQLTSVYRALLADRPTPGALIDRLQSGWALLGLQRMATALFATLDPASGQLSIASAGHLPPLLLVDGRVEQLPVRPSRMLGAPPSPAPAAEWAGVLPKGATLVLFTDGLVETRTADLDQGVAELIAAAEAAGTTAPDALCDLLLAGVRGGHRDDDIALLVLTRDG